LIQKIELKENQIKTNKVNIVLDKSLFKKEYLKCKKHTQKKKDNNSLQEWFLNLFK